ncbi:MAG TPA: sulfurtransferase TusA family protein [Nitrospiria bacterium]|nr:sulfurtransferase TusA family protein [Nitrospiria bacterium]
MTESTETVTDAELDLRGILCPYNYVKTKLKLESMEVGQILSVIVDDGEPIRNVPHSIAEDGHTILRQEKVDNSFRVLIRKRR